MQHIIEKVLALAKRKCDAAEVIASNGETMPVEFKSAGSLGPV